MLLIVFTLGSCSLERDLSKTFLEKRDNISILLSKPDFVFKTNNKSWQIQDFDKMSNDRQEAALQENSLFLNKITDSVFLEKYFTALTTGLNSFGISVYEMDQLMNFMEQTGTLYQVSVAQIELEEDIFPYHVEETFDDTVVYFEDFELNTVNVNNWFEIHKLNDAQAVNNLLYASHYLMDQIEGQFAENIFTGEVKYKYNLFPMDTNSIYEFAGMLGEKYAGYIFDYLINEFVFRNFPENQRPGVYMHYDHEYRILTPAGSDRFIFMQE
jgi:hypothetical protein